MVAQQHEGGYRMRQGSRAQQLGLLMRAQQHPWQRLHVAKHDFILQQEQALTVGRCNNAGRATRGKLQHLGLLESATPVKMHACQGIGRKEESESRSADQPAKAAREDAAAEEDNRLLNSNKVLPPQLSDAAADADARELAALKENKDSKHSSNA